MKISKIALVYAFAVILFPAPALHAQDTEQMLSACRPLATAKIEGDTVSMPRTVNAGMCWGAFDVIQTIIGAEYSTTKEKIFRVCAPSNSTRTQLISIFVYYAENHPATYSQRFTWTALHSLRLAFPCSKSR